MSNRGLYPHVKSARRVTTSITTADKDGPHTFITWLVIKVEKHTETSQPHIGIEVHNSDLSLGMNFFSHKKKGIWYFTLFNFWNMFYVFFYIYDVILNHNNSLNLIFNSFFFKTLWDFLTGGLHHAVVFTPITPPLWRALDVSLLLLLSRGNLLPKVKRHPVGFHYLSLAAALLTEAFILMDLSLVRPRWKEQSYSHWSQPSLNITI